MPGSIFGHSNSVVRRIILSAERTLTVLTGMVKARPMLNNAGIASYVANWILSSLRQEDLWPGGKVPGVPFPAGAVRVDSSDLPTPAPIPFEGFMPSGDTSVRLEILIGNDGRVEQAQYIAGLATLAEGAVQAARQWKFPQMEKGRAVQAMLQIDDTVTRGSYQPAKFSPGIPGGFGTSIGGLIGGIIGGLPGPPPPPIDASLVAAQLVRRVEPVYPAAAKSSGVTGMVRFRATLGPDGTVTSLQLLSGNPMLVNAARTAVSQWLYNPWNAGGKQVEISTTIDVEVK
jgi:TonB family protein